VSLASLACSAALALDQFRLFRERPQDQENLFALAHWLRDHFLEVAGAPSPHDLVLLYRVLEWDTQAITCTVTDVVAAAQQWASHLEYLAEHVLHDLEAVHFCLSLSRHASISSQERSWAI
jgi:hypothetical protein